MDFVISIYIAIYVMQHVYMTSLMDGRASRLIYAWGASQASGEVMSAVGLVWWLIIRPRRRHGRLSRPGSIVRRLVVRAVETKVLSICFQVFFIICYSQAKTGGAWVGATLLLRWRTRPQWLTRPLFSSARSSTSAPIRFAPYTLSPS